MRQSNCLKLCAVLIPLLAFLSWSVNAQAPGQRAFPDLTVLLLPDRGGVMAAPASLASPINVLLQEDSGISSGFVNNWAAGNYLGVVLQASILQYPLTIESVEGYISRWEAPPDQSAETVTMRAHIYSISDGAPAALLGSSEEVLVDLSGSEPWRKKWQSFPLTTPVMLEIPQAFLAVVEYVTGTEGSAPSVVIDVSTDIPTEACYFKSGSSGEWVEHYAMPWTNAAEVGYQMIRARVQTSGGPSDTVVLSPLDDTYLRQDVSTLTQGTQKYLLIGQYGTSGEAMRAMLRFPDLTPPIEGATPVAASLRLYHWDEADAAVPLRVTAHRVTESWNEETAAWYTNSTSYAEAYGTDEIPARDAAPRRNYLLSIDLSELVADWLAGVLPNYGVMLIGGENTPESVKWFRSSNATIGDVAERPQLIVQWALPSPTPYGTPGPTATITPTPTATRTMMPPDTDTPTATPDGALTDTPMPTETPTFTDTPTPSRTATASQTPTLTGTPDTSSLLFLPLIEKG